MFVGSILSDALRPLLCLACDNAVLDPNHQIATFCAHLGFSPVSVNLWDTQMGAIIVMPDADPFEVLRIENIMLVTLITA